MRWTIVVATMSIVGCGGKIAADSFEDASAEPDVVLDTTIDDSGAPSIDSTTPPPDSTPPVDSSPPIDSTPPPDTTPPPPDTGNPCPDVEPPSGSACSPLGVSCGWVSGCGGVNRGECIGGAWSVTIGVCPPPTAGCPATRPSDGTSCTTSSETCLYDNGCGAVGIARCTPSGWSVSLYPCKDDCPKAPPVINSPCTAPPKGVCGYTFGPTCSFDCFCWEGSWTCYGTPCTDPPTGSGLDGGT